MRCDACGFANPEGTKFCGECGARLTAAPVSCPACGFENPASFRFCGDCGAALTGSTPPAPRRDTAERRQLTVLFCDLVGSTELAARLDPEEYRAVVSAYQRAAGEAITRFGGHVAQVLGDGLLVYFGYPQAFGDDARRAVHTALATVDAVRTLSPEERGGQDLQVRVGIHTGEVVTGEVTAGRTRELLAMGQAPNVAARVQALAEPNQVLLTQAVDRLVRGYFDCEALGSRMLKGLNRPTELFRVIRETGVRDSFEVAVHRGLTPVAGRQAEIEDLVERARAAAAGRQQVVLVVGEAGIGKSRLVNIVRERTGGSILTRWATTRCSAFGGQTALNPFAELLESEMDVPRSLSPSERVHRLREATEAAGLDAASVPLFAELVGIPAEGAYMLPDVSPQRRRDLLTDALMTFLDHLTAAAPVGVVIEDLHWADPSTLEVLSRVAQRETRHPLLLILTARPGFEAPWDDGPGVRRIELNRLESAHVVSMVGAITGGMALPTDLLEHILDKTDGVPLFVEELTKAILESGVLVPSSVGYEYDGWTPRTTDIPTTLQDSLAARLDRLGDARLAAQVASVLGREFSYRALHAVSELEHGTLQSYLTRLITAEILFVTGDPPDATYQFKHALIGDAAYSSLVKTTRREYHRRAAVVLTERFADLAAARPELVAHHYAEAGLIEPAVGAWLKAGQRAIARFANAEAIDLLGRALDLLSTLPASPERYGREIAIQATLGSALVGAKGYAADDVRAAFARAFELSEPMGDVPELFRALQGLWMFYVVRAEYAQALTLALRLSRSAPESDRALRMQSHYCIAFTRFYLGEFTEARRELEAGLTLDDDTTDFQSISPTGDDIRVHLQSILSLALWHLGLPDAAVERSDAALTLARRVGHPYGISWALVIRAWLFQLRREPDRVLTHAGEGLQIAQEKGLSYLIGLNGFLASLAGASLTDDPETLRELVGRMDQIVAGIAAAGARLGYTLMISQQLDLCVARGLYEEASQRLDAAADHIESTEEQSWRAEFERLQAEMLLHAGPAPDLDAAEAAFRRAVTTAEAQSAPGLVLRATLGLAEVLRRGGRPAEARTAVESALLTVDATLDTGDLQAAKQFLQQLA